MVLCKHNSVSLNEIKFINSIEMKKCPYCQSEKIIKFGHYKTLIQKYKCKKCLKRFSPITNTIFNSKKISISEWIEYLMHLFEFHSIKSSARDNRNSESTGKYWLKKVFLVLKDCQKNVILEDNIYLDEMYFPVIKSKVICKNEKNYVVYKKIKLALLLHLIIMIISSFMFPMFRSLLIKVHGFLWENTLNRILI